MHLKEDRLCDGLEIWLVSIILRKPISVFMEEVIWCSSKDRIDFQYPTLILMDYGYGLLCSLSESESELWEEESIAVDDCMQSQLPVVSTSKGGRPMVKLLSQLILMRVHLHVQIFCKVLRLILNIWWIVRAKAQYFQNPLDKRKCEFVLYVAVKYFQALHWSGIWEAFILRWNHVCEKCQAPFNNLCEVSSHNSVVHRESTVQCFFCDYRCTTHAWMCQHVRVHLKGEKCDVCEKTFPSIQNLKRHRKLYKERSTFECDQCDSVFHSPFSLSAHKTVNMEEGILALVERFSSCLDREYVTRKNASCIECYNSRTHCNCWVSYNYLFPYVLPWRL